MRRFQLHRERDLTDSPGRDIVAEGVHFSTGWVALTWLTNIHSLVFYPLIEHVEKLDGHDGAIKLVWLDE